jgi:hypothetical protein
MKTKKTIKTLLLMTVAAVGFARSAAATPQDDTTTSSVNGTIQNVTPGHSQYANFFFTFPGNCGSAYNTNGVRVSTGHPGYEEMVKTLLVATLSRAEVIAHYQLISGQCWLKRILIWNP